MSEIVSLIGLYKKEIDQLKAENEELKQALKEIQQTAHKSILQGKMTSSGWLYQKISEVIDENP